MKNKVNVINWILTMFFLFITISGCDSVQTTSDVSSQVDDTIIKEITDNPTISNDMNTPIPTPIPTLEPTPTPEQLDVIQMMISLASTKEYEKIMEMKTKYCIDTFHGYESEHLQKIHYVVFSDKFELNGIHYDLTPNQVVQMNSDARLFEFTNKYEGYEKNEVLTRITYYLQYEQQGGVLLIIPKESYYLVGISQ